MTPEEKSDPPKLGTPKVERRKHPRLKVNLPIEYRRVEFDAVDQFTGRVLNISEGGLEIHFSESMEVGQQLTLKLFCSTEPEPNTIGGLAEIVWAEFIPGGEWGDYRYGVKFVELSPDEGKKLKDFILSLSE